MTTSQCECRTGFFALYADPDNNCGITLQAWKICVRVLLLILALVSLVLWSTKLFFLFRNISRYPFDLAKMMAYCWLLGCTAAFVILIACEARMTGDALIYMAIACFSMFEFSLLCLLFYTNWFGLLCLSLLLNMDKQKTTLFSRIHFALYGALIIVLISSALIITPFLLPEPLDHPSRMVSSTFAEALLFAMFVSLLCVLAYNAIIFLVPIIAVLVRYYPDPPALIRSTKTFWILHFILGFNNLVAFLVLAAVLIQEQVSPSFNSPPWSLALTLVGVLLVFQITLTAYCTINHRGDEQYETISTAPNPATPLVPSPRTPRTPRPLSFISPALLSEPRSHELFITRFSDWEFRPDSTDPELQVHLVALSDDN